MALKPSPVLWAAPEGKRLSLICTELGYGLALILEMGKLRLSALGKAQTGPPSDILNYNLSGRETGIFGAFGGIAEVQEGHTGWLVPSLTERKGQLCCWACPVPLSRFMQVVGADLGKNTPVVHGLLSLPGGVGVGGGGEGDLV